MSSVPEVVQDIVEQHAVEAAFNWLRRDEAAHSPAYDLLELCELDDRLCCHLDGLSEGASAGWDASVELLEAGEPGALFTAVLLAIERGDWKAFADLLDRASEGQSPRELISALGWLPFGRLELVLRGMKDGPVGLQRIGIATHALHRRDPGPGLAQAAHSMDPALAARAFRAIGELRRHDLRADLASGYDAEDEGCRFWSAWSGSLLGDRDAHGGLIQLSETSETYGRRACDLLMRVQGPAARHSLETIAARSQLGLRHALFGAGALGDPALVPWLLSFLQDEACARPAAWSLTVMLNLRLTGPRGAKPPTSFVSGPIDDPDVEDVAPDGDEDLPWPDPRQVEEWWKQRASDFAAKTRYLLGRPIEPAWLQHVLCNANQVARASAALELCLSSQRGDALFEVRAPGFEQLAVLWGV